MNENKNSFYGHSFLKKEAANPGGLLQGVRMFNREERAANKLLDHQKGGTGGFTIDGLGWLAKKVPGLKAPIEKGMGAYRGGLENLDTSTGSLVAGSNAQSLRHKVFSKNVKTKVGERPNSDGGTTPLYEDVRQPSLFAPVEKTVKFTTPFLATAYVADKLYPETNKDLGENVNQTTYEQELQKSSAVFDDSLSDRMDKIASMQKIAELEDLLEKHAEELEMALLDKKATMDQLENVMMEKVSMEKRAASAERNLLEKQAEHEELRLRTIAQKRSKVAVELAEGMLENNLIKQAQYTDTIDKLMECDEHDIKMYESLVKEARTRSDSLESLSYFDDYKGNEKLVAATDLAKNGLSKRGQTMGEAARDLTK